MKYSFKKINIESPFPTRQCGHSCQIEKLFTYHDPLYARVTALADEDNWIIHYSMDLLAFDLKHRNELEEQLKDFYHSDKIRVLTSTTHTHYANDVRDPEYVDYLMKVLYEQTVMMEYEEIDDVTASFQKIHSTAVGKSRISGYELNNEYLSLIRFYKGGDNFLSIVYYNCHPTVLKADTPYFSAEYPGYVLKKLEDSHPDTDFTFLQGAAGDISSRFVRDGQDYEAMAKLGNVLFVQIQDLYQEDAERVPLRISYKDVPIEYKHEFTPIDLSKIRSDLSEREMETIRLGQIERAKLEQSNNMIFGKLIEEALIVALDLGCARLVFFPNEIFSYYMNFLQNENELLVSYSNGYGPYVLPPDFEYITYEMFTDTLTKDTKEKLINILETI